MRGAAHRRISYENTGCDSGKVLHIEGMPKVEKLNALVGGYINLEYRLPNGQTVKFLDDNATYLGNQLECESGGDRSLISIAINKKSCRPGTKTRTALNIYVLLSVFHMQNSEECN